MMPLRDLVGPGAIGVVWGFEKDLKKRLNTKSRSGKTKDAIR